MTRRMWLAAVPVAALTGCGYRVAGKASTVPKTVRTIAVPAFDNSTTRYRLTDALPLYIGRELLSRTRFQVIEDASQADAVLEGRIATVTVFPTVFDPLTGRAAGVEAHVILDIKLRERLTGNYIYNQPALAYRQRYEISTNPKEYFDESTTAFVRLSRDVARSVVSAVIEGF